MYGFCFDFFPYLCIMHLFLCHLLKRLFFFHDFFCFFVKDWSIIVILLDSLFCSIDLCIYSSYYCSLNYFWYLLNLEFSINLLLYFSPSELSWNYESFLSPFKLFTFSCYIYMTNLYSLFIAPKSILTLHYFSIIFYFPVIVGHQIYYYF